MAKLELTGHSFLDLMKNDINSVLKIPVANLCRLITLKTYPGHVWPP